MELKTCKTLASTIQSSNSFKACLDSRLFSGLTHLSRNAGKKEKERGNTFIDDEIKLEIDYE